MKKYILKRKGESSDLGKFNTKQDAVDTMNDVIEENNDCLVEEDEDWLSPFDFELEEADIKEPAELVPDFRTACKYLDISECWAEILSKGDHPIAKAAVAFYKLCIIAKAWNGIDGFVPNFSDGKQCKYYPWFEYRKDVAALVCGSVSFTGMSTGAGGGSWLCFATQNRAEQFGKMFQDLYNQMLL